MEDNITTDHIMPSNAKLLPYRSNVPYLSDYCLTPVDESFPRTCKGKGGGLVEGRITDRALPVSMRRWFRCTWESGV